MRNAPPSSLLAAAVEAADDAPRLVLADWLCERGDPSGEWLLSWLDPPGRSGLVETVAVHRTLFEGWPRQHAIVAWQGGFVRELVVRLPGVGAGLVARVLDHPTLALVERLTFATARLPLFERGVLDAMVAAVRGAGPHRRLRAVTFAGLPVPPDELDAVRDHLGRAAPRLERLEILPDLDPGSRQWLEIADRLDPIAPDSRPGPFSPAPGELRQPLDDADEEALWLDHGEWCDVREEESP